MLLQSWPHDVLAHYPALLRGAIVFLGNSGGFSGAHLWRLDTSHGSFCLKAWPTDGRSPRELAWIHGLMARASALPWMPRVMPTSAGATVVSFQDRLWEVLTWMPGHADFALKPSVTRLEAACTALAEVHLLWATSGTKNDVCPAVRRRLASWEMWRQLLYSGWRPEMIAGDPYAPLAEQLWQDVSQRFDDVPTILSPWLTRTVPIQPCVCDPWHDHVLFTSDAVTGLIDFGSVKEDHVAVDLARMLGSLIGSVGWEAGFAAYQRVRPLSAKDRTLAHDLDRTGTMVAATHWLRWLYHERRHYDNPAAVVKRLEDLSRNCARVCRSLAP